MISEKAAPDVSEGRDIPPEASAMVIHLAAIGTDISRNLVSDVIFKTKMKRRIFT